MTNYLALNAVCRFVANLVLVIRDTLDISMVTRQPSVTGSVRAKYTHARASLFMLAHIHVHAHINAEA